MRDAHWVLSTSQPSDWATQVERVDGGFYHSPPGLMLGAPAGAPLFCRLQRGEEVVGVALGVLSRCRFSARPRHVYFPSLPALARAPSHEGALSALVGELKARGAADIEMDSYDAHWAPDPGGAQLTGRVRHEYVVPLTAEPATLARSFGKAHRQSCWRGEREKWALRLLSGEEAIHALTAAEESTAERVRKQGRSFLLALPVDVVGRGEGEPHEGWGASTFAAYDGEVLLSAGLVGRAGHRGYLIVAGSTPEGYRRSASAWLYWRIMAWLYERGFTSFNLGGSPGSPTTASDPADPHHGLFRFKTRFGAEIVATRCGRWEVRPGHVRLHRLARWIAS
jgi:hypothetical protein